MKFIFQDIDPVALTYIIEFMYCGIVEVPKKRLEEVLHVAKQLQIKGLYNSANCDRNGSLLTSSTITEEIKTHGLDHDIETRDSIPCEALMMPRNFNPRNNLSVSSIQDSSSVTTKNSQPSAMCENACLSLKMDSLSQNMNVNTTDVSNKVLLPSLI